MTVKNQRSSEALPTTCKAALYIRNAVAGRGQLLSDITALERELLLKFAINAGWTPEQLIVFEDSGISANAPLERREALSALLQAIERDEVKAVLIYAEHCLWRDGKAIEVAAFIELCKTHAVILITPTRVYDFTNPLHIHLFRFQVEAVNVAIYVRMNSPQRLHTIHKNTLNRRGRARVPQSDESTVIAYQLDRLFTDTEGK